MIRDETLNDKRLRLVRERDALGRELVMSAANGDVQNCRRVLEKEILRSLCLKKLQPTDGPTTLSYALTPRQAALSCNYSPPPTEDEKIFTNFVSSGHTPLQAASQNGHANVCRVLIGEFGANVEFQVQELFYIF